MEQGGNTVTGFQKSVTTAINSGTTWNAERLKADVPSGDYKWACLTARRVAASATTIPASNVSNIHLSTTDSALTVFATLAPGESIQLPHSVDLYQIFLAQENASDGVHVAFINRNG